MGQLHPGLTLRLNSPAAPYVIQTPPREWLSGLKRERQVPRTRERLRRNSAYIYILAKPFRSCMTLGKLLNNSVPQVPRL